MTMHRQSQKRAHPLRHKLVGFGISALAFAALGGIALSPTARPVRAAYYTPAPVSGDPGQLIRTNPGITISANQTVVATYVVIGPGGVTYGPDGTILATPNTAPGVSGTAVVGPAPGISTPTQVVAPITPYVAGTAAATGTANPQRYYIGGLDSTALPIANVPIPYMPPTLTPTSTASQAVAAPLPTSVTGYVAPTPVTGYVAPTSATGYATSIPTSVTGYATPIPNDATVATGQFNPTATVDTTNPDVIVGTPSGGVSSSGVVGGNGGRGGKP